MTQFFKNKNAVIRHQESGLVLDGSEDAVKFQHFTGFAPQLWKFEEHSTGKYIIINQGSKKALDIEGGIANGNNLITFKKHGETNQQWYINSDGSIISAGGNFGVNAKFGKFKAGNNAIAYQTHGKENQIFYFQFQ